MNANELADELVWIAKNRGDSISRQLADIVRQQQAEIEELKAKLQLHDAMDNQCASLMQQFRKVQEK